MIKCSECERNYNPGRIDINYCKNKPIDFYNLLSENTNGKNISRTLAWTPGQTITISFIEDPPVDLIVVPKSYYYTYVDEYGKQKPLDPLIYETYQGMDIKAFIQRIIRERFELFVGLKFEFIPYNVANPAIIRIGFYNKDDLDASETWCALGKDALKIPAYKRTFNLKKFKVDDFMHEFCHGLGMIHTQQRPKGLPGSINWKMPELIKWAESLGFTTDSDLKANFLNFPLTDRFGVPYQFMYGSPDFDKDSIMIYDFPSCTNENNIVGTLNARLSFNDVSILYDVYKPPADFPRQLYTPREFMIAVYNDYGIDYEIKEKFTISRCGNYNYFYIVIIIFISILTLYILLN